MVRHWIAPLVFAVMVQPAVAQDRPPSVRGGPKNFVHAWYSDSDYPAAARRANAEGSVSIVVDIDATGSMVACRITASSGNASLDKATCFFAQRRGRFFVQKDANGNPEPYS